MNLIANIYSVLTGRNISNIQQGYNKVNIWPLNILRTGDYTNQHGFINLRTTLGFWWNLSRSSMDTGARYSGTYPTDVLPQYHTPRGTGLALRCLAR